MHKFLKVLSCVAGLEWIGLILLFVVSHYKLDTDIIMTSGLGLIVMSIVPNGPFLVLMGIIGGVFAAIKKELATGLYAFFCLISGIAFIAAIIAGGA